uniref:Repressor protein n=1 Tax=Siphoviridae sp. ctKeG8 TaxID=2825443 RepID=A0A8S5PCW9_9CAUD|nr:MAG TPA: repressor protein [Siphoviridae sp. ctKeG8]
MYINLRVLSTRKVLINYTFRVNIILKGVVLAVEFKDIIKKLRLERDLSQQELAEKTGLSASSIGMYEQGRRKPSFEVLELFADTFNVDMDYLLGRSSEPNKYSRILTRAQDELSKEELQSLENMAEYFLSRKKK